MLVPVSLEGQRSTYEGDVRVIPVDADGNTVSGVTLDPQTVHVTIPVEARSDVREVRVQPNIVGELAEGYVLTPAFDYNPKTVVVKRTRRRAGESAGHVLHRADQPVG